MYDVKQRDLTPRIRVRSDDSSFGYEYTKPPVYVTYYANGSKIITLGAPVTVRTGFKKKIIDYKPIVHLGPPRLNPVSIKSVRTHSSLVTWDTLGYVGKQAIQWTGPFIGAFIPLARKYTTMSDIVQPIGFSTAVAEEVLQKTMAKLNDPSIAANEYLFEYMQVAHLLRDPFKTSVNLAKILNRWTKSDAWIYSPRGRNTPGAVIMSFRTRRELSLKKASKALIEEASQRWLQYRYGILPLYSDIATVLGQMIDGEIPSINQLQMFKQKARIYATRASGTNELYLSIGPYSVTAMERWIERDFYTANIFFQKRGLPSPSWRYGLHPRQWLTALWNAVPYSFVGDWFINVDQWLKAITVNPYVSIRGNCVTRKISLWSDFTERKVYSTSYGTGTVPLPHVLGTSMIRSDAIRREINLPYSRDIFFSVNWSSLKNILTGLALILVRK